jgi:hypothetical protein
VDYALVVETIAIPVSVVIAIWQHIALRAYRKVDQARATIEAAEKEVRRQRLDRRDSWELVFVDVQDTLRRTEDIASEARTQPLDGQTAAFTDLARLQWHLENLSARCPSSLMDPLQAVAAAIADLRRLPFPADREIMATYDIAFKDTFPHDLVPEEVARTLGVKAIAQYKATLKLHEAITGAWEAVQNERGNA